MQPHNMTDNEVINTALNSGNALAIRLATMAENAGESMSDDITDFMSDVANHFAGEIDAKLEAYNNNYLINADSDNHDWLFYGDTYIELDQLKEALEWFYDPIYGDSQLSDNHYKWAINNLDQLREEINGNLDYYCELKVGYNYSAVRGSLYGALVGETEEELKHWFTDLPNDNKQFVAMVKDAIGFGYINGEYIYFDNSDTSINLVLQTGETLTDYIDNQIEEANNND